MFLHSIFLSYLCFWVFDIICYNNNRKVSELNLLNRLHLIRTSIISPIHSLNVKLPFELRMKPMFNIEQTLFVWNDVVKDLSHESDGLIFTPIEDPYQSGACYRLLKWKPISMNSADFKIYEEYIRLFFFVNSSRGISMLSITGIEGWNRCEL